MDGDDPLVRLTARIPDVSCTMSRSSGASGRGSFSPARSGLRSQHAERLRRWILHSTCANDASQSLAVTGSLVGADEGKPGSSMKHSGADHFICFIRTLA
jgi:hypothetical protein